MPAVPRCRLSFRAPESEASRCLVEIDPARPQITGLFLAVRVTTAFTRPACNKHTHADRDKHCRQKIEGFRVWVADGRNRCVRLLIIVPAIALSEAFQR